ncbi:germin-like protein subfamily 3 member 3 [Vigna umbellata]|uniref:germin-like protein subfamily 3 member 3 n=1 Tax=Vigna umbellata TaxID=87088 RepID=UPI001F5FD951|nr:germin-like protein subfamily 3 member 3 [Vigna umbellata]XP_047147062.1 germin-like protein subfamily 3 member 3 [Vigna umbellata]
MTNSIVILLLCALLSSTSHASTLQNFCKADLSGPDSPTGYHCVPSENVTANDFKYSFNGKPGIPVPSNSLLYPADVNQIPIVNGGGLSAGLVEIAEGGFLPLHRHGANEILLVLQGKLNVGLMTPRKAYLNTIGVREFVYFPQGLSHYLINSGRGKAVAFAAYSSASPPFNFDHLEKYASDVPSLIVSRVTFLDDPQVRKLKARFNGTG